MRVAVSTMTVPARSVLPLVVAVVAYGFALSRGGGLLLDPDTYWHLATGQWMLAHLAVPHHDPFSLTMAGAPWVDHEWLSELLMVFAYRAAGWTGLVLLAALALALALGLLAQHLGRWLEPPATAMLVLLAAAAIMPGLLARPHLIALPVMEAWAAGLVIARARSRAPHWALIPLMTLWANLHGSFLVGLALAGPLAIEAVFSAGAGRRRVALRWGAFIGASVLAACLTPNLLHGLVHPLQVMRMPVTLATVSEWRSPDFQQLQPVELWVMAVLYVGLSRGVRLPVIRLLLLMGLVHAGLEHARNQILLGVIGPLIVAEPFGRFLREQDAAPSPNLPRIRIRAAAAVMALALTLFAVLHPPARTADAATPRAALDHVPPALAGRPVFNSYDFGGYLIFRGLRPYVDGRADMYGDAFIAAYLKALQPDRDALEAALRNHAIAWTLLKPDDGAVAVLDVLPGWQRFYADDVAVVHVRSNVLAAERHENPAAVTAFAPARAEN